MSAEHCNTVHTSSLSVCYCTTIYTGSTFLCASNTRSASQCTGVCRVRRPGTWWTVALQPRTLPLDSTYVRPVDIIWLYQHLLVVARAFSVAGSTLRTWRSAAAAASDSCWRRFSTASQHTQCNRDVLYDSALYKSTIDVDIDIDIITKEIKRLTVNKSNVQRIRVFSMQFYHQCFSRITRKVFLTVFF